MKYTEKFNLSKSLELEILTVTHEVFYINKEMHEIRCLICIKNKTYINEKTGKIYNQHYFKK